MRLVGVWTLVVGALFCAPCTRAGCVVAYSAIQLDLVGGNDTAVLWNCRASDGGPCYVSALWVQTHGGAARRPLVLESCVRQPPPYPFGWDVWL